MTKYVERPVIAKPDYCVPATLEMVLKHHHMAPFTQDEIASQLLIVSASDNVNPQMWGTHLERDTINDFFIRNGIALHEEYVPISHFLDDFFFAEEVMSLLKKNVTVVCGYNYSWLYGNRDDTYRHVSIIVSILVESGQVELLDPGPKNAGYNTVRIDALFDAIRAGCDGLWCIS